VQFRVAKVTTPTASSPAQAAEVQAIMQRRHDALVLGPEGLTKESLLEILCGTGAGEAEGGTGEGWP
jgi:hypothetical protein